RRVSIFGTVVAVVAWLAPGAGAAALDNSSEQAAPAPFTRLDVKSMGLTGTFRPASLAGDRRATVILKLDGASVGQRAAEARKQARELTAAEKASIRAGLGGRQQALERQVQALGGQIQFDYQDAYNGVAASVALKDLAAVSRLPGVVAAYPSRTFERD